MTMYVFSNHKNSKHKPLTRKNMKKYKAKICQKRKKKKKKNPLAFFILSIKYYSIGSRFSIKNLTFSLYETPPNLKYTPKSSTHSLGN